MAAIFAALPAVLGAAGSGSGLSILGTALSAGGAVLGGIQANAAAKEQAKSMEKKGDAEYAIAQRKMLEGKRQANLLVSRQRAVAAASGGGVSDPTVESIMGKTEARGGYNALMDMYNGATMRDDLYQTAAATRTEGRGALVGSFINAGSTIFDAIGKRRSTAEYA